MSNTTHYLYAIRDIKSDTYNTPFAQQNAHVAIRSFAAEVNRVAEGNMFNTHSEDFSLYEVGSYDHRTGLINAYPAVKLVTEAAPLKPASAA